jgi:hypothetical protein
MFLLYSVENQDSHIRLSKNAMVSLLVCGAIVANVWAFHRVVEIKRDIAFREELAKNLNDLTAAAEQIALKKHLN